MPDVIDQSTHIVTALNTILAPGQIVEIRILKATTATYKTPHTMSGYFDDWSKVPDAIKAAGIKFAPAFYFTLNPPKPELLSRAMNRIKDANETTSDADITIRRWLLIDPDPSRPAGISSTDAEHDAAIAKVKEIRDALRGKGWPDPILADSGNGAHLLYRIDLPRDDHELVRHCLEALAFWHDDGAVSIDQAVFNPARIDKLYGTRVRKGDDTPERPHRISAILETPTKIEVVSTELLEALANSRPAPDPIQTKPYNNNGKAFDLQDWIVSHGLDVKGPLKYGDGQKWIFNECPWNSEHTKSAFIIQRPDGKIGAGCRHSSCQSKQWEDVREKYEPGYKNRQPPLLKVLPPSLNGHLSAPISAKDLLAKEFAPIKWAVPGLIPEGVNMMAGRPKMGKSWLALGMAIAIGCGGRVLGQIKVEQGSVFYLGLEDSQRRLKDRLIKMLAGAAPPAGLDFTTECPRIGEGGVERIETWLQDHNDARLVVVDTYIKIRQTRKANADIYEADYQAINAYREMAERHKVAILLIHHTRKASADDPFDAILGTTGVGGSIDSGLILKRERGKADAALHVAGRDTEEREIALKWDHDLAQWTMLGDAEEFRANVLKQAIINALKRDGGSLTPKEVSDSIGDSIPGVTPGSVRQCMYRMGKDGELKITERGQYTVLLSKIPEDMSVLDEAINNLKGIGGSVWKEPF